MAKAITLHEQILSKKVILDKAKVQLKKEFIGIDKVIDELMDAVSSWYLFPDLQDKPVIINLWGLTGVGKSSLVKRMAELISFDQKFYRFDLAENDYGENWRIKSKLAEIYENVNCYPVIIALDEFQHARTIDEDGKEMDRSSNRVVWELLDSGKFQVPRNTGELEVLYDLILKLHYLLKRRIKVRNGLVVTLQQYFIKEMGLVKKYAELFLRKKNPGTQNIRFIPQDFYEPIYSLAKEKFSGPLDVKKQLLQLDGYQTIELLKNVFEFANSPKTVDCSKALVFVLGNLDEAYTMSNDYSPDMNADEFHEQSLKINITQVKNVLKVRFRNEQIARLGNIHIIYPAFNAESFYSIIKLELNKISEKIWSQQKVKINFDESICRLIYSEGVYPTQGTRPIFTTVHHVINSKLGRIFYEMIIRNLKPTDILFRADNDIIHVDFLKNKKVIYCYPVKQVLNLEKLRKNRKDDLQAITAVHESGHAVISMILLKTIPEVIYSVTAEVENNGFVYTKFKWKYVAKNHIQNRLAMFLGGYAAEKVVFGDEYVTAGSSDDIDKATYFITTMLKSQGMGNTPASFQAKTPSTNFQIHDESNTVNQEAKRLIGLALALAEKTLREQQALLLRLADYLSENRRITKDMIKVILKESAKSFSENDLIENADLLFYRTHLKNKVKKLNETCNDLKEINHNSIEFSLNKTKDDYSENA